MTHSQWSLRRLRIRFEKVMAIFIRDDIWRADCAQVNWEFLARTIFADIPSLLHISFIVADGGTLAWDRGQFKDQVVNDSLFLGREKQLWQVIPKVFRK